MAVITKFEAGFCTHISCMAVRGTGFGVCKFPARVFLIESNKCYWLWDTGYASHFEEETKKGVFSFYKKITPVYFNEDESIFFQLKELGISPHNLSGLILSHFHGDHIAGIKDFPDIPLICSGEGWQKMREKRGIRALIQGFVPGLIPSDFESRTVYIESFRKIQLPLELLPFVEGYCLPESNGEIIIVELPGHAAGHIGAFILTEQGWELIASDAGWSVKNYRDMIHPSRLTGLIMDSIKDYHRTIEKLHQLDAANIKIHLSHEEE